MLPAFLCIVITRKRTSSRSFSWFKLFGWIFGLGAAGAAAAISVFLIVFAVMYSKLPAIDSLTDYRPKVPLRVYSAEGTLIGEFGEERRAFVHLNEIPGFVKYAILAAEDNGFYEHSGIEFAGIARAAIANLITGRRGQGDQGRIRRMTARPRTRSGNRSRTPSSPRCP